MLTIDVEEGDGVRPCVSNLVAGQPMPVSRLEDSDLRLNVTHLRPKRQHLTQLRLHAPLPSRLRRLWGRGSGEQGYPDRDGGRCDGGNDDVELPGPDPDDLGPLLGSLCESGGSPMTCCWR